MNQVAQIGKAEAEQRLKDRLREEEEAQRAAEKAGKIRHVSMQLASEYLRNGTRLTYDPVKLTQCAREFLAFMDTGDFDARLTALKTAVAHMKAGKHGRAPADVTELAGAFYDFLVAEED